MTAAADSVDFRASLGAGVQGSVVDCHLQVRGRGATVETPKVYLLMIVLGS